MLFITLLSLSSLIIGLTGYFVARNELNRRGEQILRNSVVQAKDLIRSEHAKVKAGLTGEEEAQERIKEILQGPMRIEDRTRILHRRIDLGENGYFIIYDSEGFEIMHPSLEGQNVLDVKDFDDENRFLVREQIKAGMGGGGFVYYSWWLPHTDKVARKISYCDYYEPWDWIVVATAYEIDFNRAANIILLVVILTMTALVILISIIIISYIRKVMSPVIAIANGMGRVSASEFVHVEKTYQKDEVAILIDGYNNMIDSLKEAKENLARKNEYISFLAFHDDLTGLPNRHGIETYVHDRISRDCKSAFMIQLDIMGLKIINSTLGYEQGDRLLQVIGTFFSHQDNSNLYISRTGSNEFTIWAENITHKKIQTTIYDLRDSVKEHISEEGFGQIIDMYLAMSVYPLNGNNFAKLYEKTSMAMKAAKDSNNLILQEYHSEIRESIENDISMKRFLTKALSEKEITPYYQAQVDYTTGKVAGVEALARWRSAELGVVPPSVFIPAIHSQNLVIDFSNYMLDRVLSDYERLKEKYNEAITLSINVSPSYFMDKNCLENLKDAFTRYSIPAGKLTLEITEDIFISDYETIAEITNHLHNLGIHISIDDFGTGYSSLNYLTKMDFDEMKIDKSFISKIIEDSQSFQLFKVLCNIADIYGYDIIAEGVETELQLEKIKETSLRIIQGYLFSRPEPLA